MSVLRFVPPPGIWVAGGILYLALSAQVSETIRGPVLPIPDATDTPARDAAVLSIALEAPADTARIVARPLFSETRRPIEPLNQDVPEAEETEVTAPIAPAAPLPPAPPEGLELLGTMFSSEWHALIRGPLEAPERWIGVGEQIEGWQLRDIDETSATFEADDAVFAVTIQR